MNDFELICAIGSGTCGEVSKMKHKPTGKVLAVKVSAAIIYQIFHWVMTMHKKITKDKDILDKSKINFKVPLRCFFMNYITKFHTHFSHRIQFITHTEDIC